MFLWRACHNLLPTKANLFRRGICDNNLCPICQREEETVGHACWDCPAANDVWGEGSIKLQKCVSGGREFMEIFQMVKNRCEMAEVELFAITARRIWIRRNEYIHEGSFTHPSHIMREANNALAYFQKINDKTVQQGRPAPKPERIKWQPPPQGRVKINWDAAVDGNNKSIGLGIIARNDKGWFLAALYAVTFCREEGYRSTIFEGDALQVVNDVNSTNQCQSMHGHLIEDIKVALQALNQACFTHAKREANAAAHALAVGARNHVIDTMRWSSIPSCIYGIVRREESFPSS
ncbi:uncharacterized protein LOC132178194 [Corylus avellana]|uniref:uncharacterized protein LOC132178194 n=1 Tax=Corylus avellana TaxID=13451 RepID=UPI00286B8251|nr:uncharacterized protein LOC132178194 [Corylus avellana]